MDKSKMIEVKEQNLGLAELRAIGSRLHYGKRRWISHVSVGPIESVRRKGYPSEGSYGTRK